VPLIATGMARYIIVVGAKIVLKEIARLNHQSQDGKTTAIRKNPHAIDVGSKPNILLSYWYIILIVI
jgi:hypothetical protein